MPVVLSQPTTLSAIGTITGCFGRVGVPSSAKRPETAAPTSSKPGRRTLRLRLREQGLSVTKSVEEDEDDALAPE